MRLRLCLLLLLSYGSLLAQPPRPATATWVVDKANVLSVDEEAFLSQQIEYLEKHTSIEFVIAIIPSLKGAKLEDYAQEWAESWGIGKAAKDNGLLLLIALNDRKMRLHTGYGLEAEITDLSARRLLDNNLKPNFRRKAYFKGFKGFLTGLFKQLRIAPPLEMLSSASDTTSIPIARRDSSGKIIFPSGVPSFRPPSIWDPDTLLNDSMVLVINKKLRRQTLGYVGKDIWIALLKELPSGYLSLEQYVDSLQAAWMVAYPDGGREALIVYHAGLDSLSYRISKKANFSRSIQLAYTKVLVPLRPLGVSRAIAWSLDYFFNSLADAKFSLAYMEGKIFRLTQPKAYAKQQAQRARINTFDYWLNWGQSLSILLALFALLFFVVRVRGKGKARRAAAKMLSYLFIGYSSLALARFIGVVLHPEAFGDTLIAHFLFELCLIAICVLFLFGLLSNGVGGGGSSGGSYRSSSSGGGSFGGGSFGGGGASSSW